LRDGNLIEYVLHYHGKVVTTQKLIEEEKQAAINPFAKLMKKKEDTTSVTKKTIFF
jgi:hypothetical protein